MRLRAAGRLLPRLALLGRRRRRTIRQRLELRELFRRQYALQSRQRALLQRLALSLHFLTGWPHTACVIPLTLRAHLFVLLIENALHEHFLMLFEFDLMLFEFEQHRQSIDIRSPAVTLPAVLQMQRRRQARGRRALYRGSSWTFSCGSAFLVNAASVWKTAEDLAVIKCCKPYGPAQVSSAPGVVRGRGALCRHAHALCAMSANTSTGGYNAALTVGVAL
jgi:hypothetical protein